MFSYETFLYEYYDVFVKQYLLFSCSIAVTVLNVLCLYFYLRRCFDSTSRFGMIFMLFVTHIAYGCFNVLSYGSDLLPEYLFNFVKNSPRLFVLIFTLSQISQQIVAVSSAFVAVDRVLVMAGPIKYGYYKITRKLAWLAAILNIGLFFMLIGACLIIPKDAFVLKTSTIVRYYIFSPTLLIEAFLYVVFLLQFRSYVRCRTNAVAKQLTVQRNHIVMFQMISHTLLCAIPNTILAADWYFVEPRSKTIELYLEHYKSALFSISVLLSSAFTLYKMKPKKNFVRVVSAGHSSSNKKK